MEIHELNNFSGNLDANTYVAVDDTNDTGKLPYPQFVAPVKEYADEEMAALKAEKDKEVADLQADISNVDDLLSFYKKNAEINSIARLYNTICTGINLKKGEEYVAKWTLSEALNGNAYCYINDSNDQNVFSGSTKLTAGDTVFAVTFAPTQNYYNLTVKFYSAVAAASTTCSFEIVSKTNVISDTQHIIDNLRLSSLKELKNDLPFAIGALENGELHPSWKYRISSSQPIVFDEDIAFVLSDGYRGAYFVFEDIEDETSTEWHRWASNILIPKGTIFKIELARRNGEEASGGEITDAYNNDIMSHLKVYAVADAQEPSVESFEYGHHGLKSEEFMYYALWTQGVAHVVDWLVGFNGSNDDHSNTAHYNVMVFKNGYGYHSRGNHNLGHCSNADYNQETDTIIVSNGSTDATLIPTVYFVSNALQTVDDADDILITSENVLSIEFDNLEGSGCVACFGETKDIIYLMTAEKASDFANYSGKYLYKFFLGKGSTDLTELYPAESYGTFVSGKSDNEYNGTARLLNQYFGEYPVELQGLKYINGNLCLSCDLYINGVLTAYILSFTLDDTFNLLQAEKAYWIPSLTEAGEYVRTEAEGVAFADGYGYITINRSTLGDSKTLKFSMLE